MKECIYSLVPKVLDVVGLFAFSSSQQFAFYWLLQYSVCHYPASLCVLAANYSI
jgi:hypothetical protein